MGWLFLEFPSGIGRINEFVVESCTLSTKIAKFNVDLRITSMSKVAICSLLYELMIHKLEAMYNPTECTHNTCSEVLYTVENACA